MEPQQRLLLATFLPFPLGQSVFPHRPFLIAIPDGATVFGGRFLIPNPIRENTKRHLGAALLIMLKGEGHSFEASTLAAVDEHRHADQA